MYYLLLKISPFKTNKWLNFHKSCASKELCTEDCLQKRCDTFNISMYNFCPFVLVYYWFFFILSIWIALSSIITNSTIWNTKKMIQCRIPYIKWMLITAVCLLHVAIHNVQINLHNKHCISCVGFDVWCYSTSLYLTLFGSLQFSISSIKVCNVI